ncbi:hypothetical protein JCM9533A_84650 [Catenuloplanes niger JCM 9533]
MIRGWPVWRHAPNPLRGAERTASDADPVTQVGKGGDSGDTVTIGRSAAVVAGQDRFPSVTGGGDKW